MDMYIVYASLVSAAQFNWLPRNNPLTYDTGWSIVISFPSTVDVWLWVSTPAHPYLLASIYNVYGLLVSGYFSIGAEHNVSFSIWKDKSHCLVHSNLQSWANNFVSGLPYQKILEQIFCSNRLAQGIV